MKMTISEIERIRKDIAIVAEAVREDLSPTEKTSVMRLEAFAERLGEVEVSMRG